MDKQNNLLESFNRAWLLLFVAMGLPLLLYAEQAEPRVAVLYPQIREPYLSVFLDIVKGVEEGFEGYVVRYPLDKESAVEQVGSQIERDGVDAVVALGKRSYDVVKELSTEKPVLLGALANLEDERFGGIAITPAADVVLQKLKMLAPGVKTLHMVYSPERDQSLIDDVISLSAGLNLSVKPYPSHSLKESAVSYRNIFKAGADDKSAIWLLSGGTVLDNAILADVLEEAWHEKVVVFSSVLAHVKRGALFAVYPNNHGMGKSLGILAFDIASRGGKLPILPLRDVYLAVNQRTSDHLGLVVDGSLRDKIDLLLPSN